ncbi:MAG: hypothetical protein IT285_13605, partial [Bdellovibrionales bacterium]|nr:hypothetical protein [Bdellovibrionales bacterium]
MRLPRLRGAFIALAASAAAMLIPSASRATVEVDPVAPYKLVTGDVVFFAGIGQGTSSTLSSGFIDAARGYRVIDTGTTFGTYDENDLLIFDIKTSQTASAIGVGSGEVFVAMVQMKRDDGYAPMSIAAAEIVDADEASTTVPEACVIGDNCQGQDNGKAFSARYAEGATLRIGIFIGDLCEDADDQNITDIDDCENGLLKQDAGNTVLPVDLKVRFVFTAASSTTAIGDPDASEADAGSDVTLHFQNQPPQFTCPAAFTDAYFPGDERILLNTKLFDLDEADDGGADPAAILVIGEEGAPDSSSTGYSENPIFSRAQLNVSEAKVKSFTNSTATDDHPYTLCFSGVDGAGLVADFGGCACTLTDVRTASILGFLKESSCFIATASFRSGTAAPVLLLRKFRDQVLEKNVLGKWLVRTYYRWSPPAAEWLMGHPEFRGPVLRALLFVQAVAWIALHGTLAWVLFCLAIVLLASAWFRGGLPR